MFAKIDNQEVKKQVDERINRRKTIDIIAGDNVARFVLRYAPGLLIGE